MERVDTAVIEVEAPAPAKTTPARQPALFPSSDRSRVVPIFGPAPVKSPSVKAKQPPTRKPSAPSTQQQLAFGPVTNAPRRQRLEVESEIYCTAPVATTQHRVVAAFVDCGIVLTAIVVVIGIFSFWSGGSFTSDPVSLAIAGALAAMVIAFYQSLWMLANGDTAGMRMAQLTLVNFDGRRPNRRQRLARFASSWLSIIPGGLGLFWALVDEEKLTWHDQISKTFPTPAIEK